MILSKPKVAIAVGLTASFMGATAHAQNIGYYKPTANPDKVNYYTIAGDEPGSTGQHRAAQGLAPIPKSMPTTLQLRRVAK